MRVVFVCQVFHPDPTSTSQLFTELMRRIDADRVRLTVLCDFPTGIDVPVPRRERLGDIEIVRCGLRLDHKTGWLSRTASYIAHVVNLFWKLWWIRKPDLLFGVTNPPFSLWPLGLMSWLRRIRFQYMILDMYPDGLIALGKLDGRSLVARAWIRANRWCYGRAERVIVLGRDMMPLLEERYGVPASRCAHVPHWSAVEAPAPSWRGEAGGACGALPEGRLTIQYSGNMGLWHDMETLVRAAARLRDDRRVRFHFIGDGVRRAPAERLARELGATNVDWRDFVPLSELWESLKACDVALISQRAGLRGVAVPCKLYGILASGRAVLAQVPPDSEVALTVEEHGCGIVVAPGDTDGLVEAIRSLADAPETVREMADRARRAYHEHYSVAHAVHAFERLWGLPERAPPAGTGRAAADGARSAVAADSPAFSATSSFDDR